MASKTAKAQIFITTNTAGANKGFDSLSKRITSLGNKFTSLGKRMTTFVSVPIVAVGVKMLKLSSDAEETQAKFDTVFKDMAGTVNKWANNLGSDLGRSKTDLKGYLSTFQDTFVPMGFARDNAAGLSQQLTKLGLDLASFNNKAEPDVMRDLQSAIVGNHETVRKYGVIITQATMEQEAYNMGLKKSFKELTEQEKAMIRLNLILKSTTDAQGDAARTSNSWANTMRAVKSLLKEAGEQMGDILKQNLRPLLNKFKEGLQLFVQANEKTKKLIVIFGALAAAIGPASLAIGLLIKGFAMLFTPIGAVIAGITGVIIVFRKLYKTNEAFKQKINAIWHGIREKISGFITDIKQVIDILKGNIKINLDSKNLNKISTRVKKIVKVMKKLIGISKDIIKFYKKAWDKVIPKIKDFGKSFIEVYNNYIRPFLERCKDVFKGIIEFIAPILIQLKDSFLVFVSFIKPIWLELVETFKSIITVLAQIWKYFKKHLLPILSVLFTVVVSVVNGIIQAVGPLVEFVLNVVQIIIDAIGFVIAVINGDWKAAWGFVKDIVKNALQAVVNILTALWEFIKGIFQGLWSVIKTPLINLKNNIVNKFNEVKNSVLTKLKELKDKMIGKFNDIKDKFKNIGKNIVYGLWNGVKSLGSWLVNKLTRWAKDKIPGPIRNALGIHSPSKVFMGFGKNIAQGLANGMFDGSSLVDKASKGLANMVNGGFGTPNLAFAGGYNIPGSNNINTNQPQESNKTIIVQLTADGIVTDQKIIRVVKDNIEVVDQEFSNLQTRKSRGGRF